MIPPAVPSLECSALATCPKPAICFIPSPARCRVQMPAGPRKSGMPHAVLMPAPVKATMRRARRTCDVAGVRACLNVQWPAAYQQTAQWRAGNRLLPVLHKVPYLVLAAPAYLPAAPGAPPWQQPPLGYQTALVPRAGHPDPRGSSVSRHSPGTCPPDSRQDRLGHRDSTGGSGGRAAAAAILVQEVCKTFNAAASGG